MKAVARRSFLRFMSAAPLAVGLMSKQVAAQIASSNAEMLTGVAVVGRAAEQGLNSAPSSQSRAFSVLRLAGIPAWKKREIRQYAERNRVLDPDIASFRSVSLSAKLRIQTERNCERMERDFWDGFVMMNERESWLKRYGLDWL